MRRWFRWLLPALGAGQLLLIHSGFITGRSALVTGAGIEVAILLTAG